MVLDSFNGVCSSGNTFCHCYYIDVLVNHCIRYCVDGLNSMSMELYESICSVDYHFYDLLRGPSGGIFEVVTGNAEDESDDKENDNEHSE